MGFKEKDTAFEPGDPIEITKGSPPYYNKGDKGILRRNIGTNLYMVDFTCNPEYYTDGHWIVEQKDFKLIEDQPKLQSKVIDN